MSNYSPRPGTKCATAVAALLDGPMSMKEIGDAIDVPAGSVSAFLKPAITDGAIIKLKDETGLLHLALAGMPVDERFTAHGGGPGKSESCLGKALTAAPLVRKVTSHPDLSADAIAAANPFGRRQSPSIEPREVSNSDAGLGWISSKPVIAVSPPPTPSAEPDFLAGIFTNGEISITLGQHHIRLNSTHAQQLRALLNNTQEQA